MSKQRMLTGLAFIAAAVIALQFSADTDTWWHLAAGRWMVEHGQILQQDVFSQTMQGEPWANPGWLAQLSMYGVYRLGGLPGLNLLTAVLALGGLLFLWAVMEGPELWKAFVLVLTASASAVFWSARPQMFTFLLTALFLWTLERWRADEASPLWILPVASALWANLHGGFAVGSVLIAAYLFGTWISVYGDGLTTGCESLPRLTRRAWQRSRRSAFYGTLSIIALVANPNGPSLLLYPFETVSIKVLQRYIQEWQSPEFGSPQFFPFVLLLFATMLAFALSRRRRSPVELVLTFGFAYLALDAARNISLFALVAAPALSRHGYSALKPIIDKIGTGPEPPERISRPLNLALLGLTLLAAGLWVRPKLLARPNAAQVEDRLPVAAVEYLEREGPPGPLFNTYRWGGYLVWRLYPEYHSYVDGRTDLFGDEILEQYLRLWSVGPGWESVLADGGFRTALLEPNAPLANALALKGWRVEFEDTVSVLLAAPE